MNNVSDKERCCIKKSHEERLAAAKTRLTELKEGGIPFDSPVSGIAGGIEWKEGVVGKLKQVAIFPVTLLLLLILVLLMPFAYAGHVLKLHQKKNELEREIREIDAESLSDKVPDEKDVESLWGLHGLDNRKYSLDERVNLLDAWIGVLYGNDASNDLRLKYRAEQIAERNFKANLACHEDKNAPHFLFVSPVDSLARQVSEKLPPYR